MTASGLAARRLVALVLLLAPVTGERDQPAHDVRSQPGCLRDVLQRRVVVPGAARRGPEARLATGQDPPAGPGIPASMVIDRAECACGHALTAFDLSEPPIGGDRSPRERTAV